MVRDLAPERRLFCHRGKPLAVSALPFGKFPHGVAVGFTAWGRIEPLPEQLPPDFNARRAIERAAERDFAEVYRLFLARVAKMLDDPEEAN
jgi:hypothetical protein